MRQIWTRDVAEHEGEHVSFTPLVAWPKPVQRPSVPVIIGCKSRHFRRVVAHADGWGPLLDGPPGAELPAQIAELQRVAGESGRASIPVTVFRVVPEISQLELGSKLVIGEAELRSYREMGVDRLVVVLPPERERMLPLLEHYARLMG